MTYRRMSLADSQGPVPGQPQFAVLGSVNGEYRQFAGRSLSRLFLAANLRNERLY
jgi:hypothetical protein